MRSRHPSTSFEARGRASPRKCAPFASKGAASLAAFRQPDTKWEEKKHRRQALEKLVEMGYAGAEPEAGEEPDGGDVTEEAAR